ncbi:hypothetical protein [Dyella telluris]|uniref:Uncharacterized protein n=1 Tax=Dyella telluris TaxID=2763498 RepID=A0A7G8Q9C2_9GAMM|nr:hypothetical protein [Dyella telluris]QNK03380.1 hypothetical protein H8F01_09860 [Dyella telluris]
MQRFVAPAVLAVAVVLGGCQASTPTAPAPVHGYVTDMKAFDAFIATHPTPDQFRAAYPDVQLVLPGTVTTLEFRMNNSRYYPELDKDGRITGGRFS